MRRASDLVNPFVLQPSISTSAPITYLVCLHLLLSAAVLMNHATCHYIFQLSLIVSEERKELDECTYTLLEVYIYIYIYTIICVCVNIVALVRQAKIW